VEAIDKLRDTAAAFHRAFVIEVMGRDSGWIALQSAIAAGAEMVLIPEEPFELEQVIERMQQVRARGRRHFVLVAAEGVLIPMQCEYYALEGLTALVDTIEQIKAGPNPGLEIHGILRTMFDPRNNLANEVSAQLVEHFREKVFRTIIPRNVRLAEAPSYGKPALHYDRESRGALAYLALAGEMIRREDGDYAAAAAGSDVVAQ